MRDQDRGHHLCCCSRRDFLETMGTAAGTMALLSGGAITAVAEDDAAGPQKGTALVRGAFIYPPSEGLRKAGYWSWPGSSFDPEGHQRRYLPKIQQIEKKLGMRIQMDATPLDEEASITRFIAAVRQSGADGLLLFPFKENHWPRVRRIVEEAKLPTVLLATLGVLPQYCIQDLHRKTGAYLINAMDDFDSVEAGMQMIRTARRMKDSLLLNVARSQPKEVGVPHLGTRVRTLPLERFYTEFRQTKTTAQVKELAQAYLNGARECVEPTEADVLEAARATIAFRRILQSERADAIMMDCLSGLRKPHKHVPPCMAFMSLRDEGVAAGCQSDLNGTLTMMLLQELFGKPGFQQNSSVQTEENHFFGAHCTAPSKMNGTTGRAEPYILRSHNEAGWGCVPQVLFPAGQPLTMALYRSAEAPQMWIYSGEVVRCYPKAPGGCRTNVKMTINELDDACNVKGRSHEHLIIVYGNHVQRLKRFCQLYGIEVAC